MSKIEDGQRINQLPLEPVKQPQEQLTQPLQEQSTPFVPTATAKQRADLHDYGAAQRLRLNQQVDEQESSNNGVLAGGLVGAGAARFEISEARVRNTTPILINTFKANREFMNQIAAHFQEIASGTTIERRPASVMDQIIESDPYAPHREGWQPPPENAEREQWNKKYGNNIGGVVRLASGDTQGHRLLRQLSSGGLSELDDEVGQATGRPGYRHKGVVIQFDTSGRFKWNDINKIRTDESNATVTGSDALGSVLEPGRGVGGTASYHPTISDGDVPLVNADGTISQQPMRPVTTLVHELAHAMQAQRGTDDPRLGTTGYQHYFHDGSQWAAEGDFRGTRMSSEFRTVGVPGARWGDEPNEDSVRAQLELPQRAAYLSNGNYENRDLLTSKITNTVKGHEPVTPEEAGRGIAAQNYQRIGTLFADGLNHSRPGALLGAIFGASHAALRETDAKRQELLLEVAGGGMLGATAGVTEEVIQRAVNGPVSTVSGMTMSTLHTAATHLRGAKLAGGVINAAFAAWDQRSNLQLDDQRSRAIGVIAGEAIVGAAAGATGAYAGAMAGAAVGSVIPVAGTAIGAVVGFAAGAAAGYVMDRGLRAAEVHRTAGAVVQRVYEDASRASSETVAAIKSVPQAAEKLVSSVGRGTVRGPIDLMGEGFNRLSAVFGR